MRRIPVSLGQVLRRYAFSYTQLRRDVVPYQVHGALRAPPNEADLGPARFWAGVHRRERCGPESDGGQLARRLVGAVRRWPTGPGALRPRSRSRRQPFTVARAAVATRGGRGSPPCRPGPRPRACETNKKALQRFHSARSTDFMVHSSARTALWCPRRPRAARGLVCGGKGRSAGGMSLCSGWR